MHNKYLNIINLNPDYIQNRVSFSRTMYRIYIGQDIKNLENEPIPFDGLDISGGLDFLYLIDLLVRVIPIPVTFPIHRGWDSLHFFGDGVIKHDHILLYKGFYQSLLAQSNPRTMDWNPLAQIFALESISGDNIFRTLRMSCDATNSIASFLMDHKNFVEKESRKFIYFDQLRLFSLFKLIINDLASIHMNPHPHSQITFCFALFDKLANFKYIFDQKRNETDLFNEMFSYDFMNNCKVALTKHSMFSGTKFGRGYLQFYENCFNALHHHVGAELKKGAAENDRIERIRSFRNINHGLALHRQQFERLYGAGKGTLPAEITYYSQITFLAICLDPNLFMKF